MTYINDRNNRTQKGAMRKSASASDNQGEEVIVVENQIGET